ncbi:YchJ family protein [Psychrobacter sp.]|uniref:YchJ family protein n=1 Tax=Psychrobacter sp. TaxID=56811 RepID=UPI00264902E2|nr:YchJ family protein [Psychrobacter sp.]MDN6275738.1 YchJ family protein [Psychrobacter sp.]MDN6308948.1 YchJ family protein [Psychrobacter sp.]
MESSLQPCPCQVNPHAKTSTALPTYQDCCQPYHDGFFGEGVDTANSVTADTAERLMRTRYSAFVLVKPEYIVKTTLPAQQKLLDIQAIEQWAKDTSWAGLNIVKHTPKLGKRHAQVEFQAYFQTPEGLQAHHELSAFVKIKDNTAADKKQSERWYFLDPTMAMSVTQKQPCICGSGEKFKRCCGGYI